jgi:hypothetical protein
VFSQGATIGLMSSVHGGKTENVFGLSSSFSFIREPILSGQGYTHLSFPFGIHLKKLLKKLLLLMEIDRKI